TNVWLVNTGWSGGPHGTGSRMRLAITRAILDAIHSGALARAATVPDPVFGIAVVSECPGVSSEVLIPRQTWADATAYDRAANRLAGLFRENFRQFEPAAGSELLSGGPVS